MFGDQFGEFVCGFGAERCIKKALSLVLSMAGNNEFTHLMAVSDLYLNSS